MNILRIIPIAVLLATGAARCAELAAQSPSRKLLSKTVAYVLTNTFAAPEANQAAAADERFVYAIDNAVVAKYDRVTGRRLGSSTGQAFILATGHDHRVIYRLRLPGEGTVLELVDIVPSPFPGQSIAIDPKTGGLLGIDRARRRIVFANLVTSPAAGDRNLR